MKNNIKNNKGYLIGTILIFILMFICSTRLVMSQAPDEYMRYSIPQYIVNHGTLPNGNEKEILNAIWGFSYGFTPYLPSLISVLFMKIVMLFTHNASYLLVAARLTSVLAGSITFFICCKIGEEIFNKKITIYLFSIIVTLLPQFFYLSLYLNNDSFSVMTTALIVYAWIKGIKTNWQYFYCVFLGVSIGLCALTYYNAYGFILCSIFVYCISCYQAGFDLKTFFVRGMIIALSAFIIGGWFFIRNAMIHHGDFLGMNSMYECGEKYAQDGYQLSKRMTYEHQGIGVVSMLLHTNWFIDTAKSFVCASGYMKYIISNILFVGYVLLSILGLGSTVIGLKNNYQLKFKLKPYFIICLILCMLIPIVLSIKYSYSIDYQPQGRYIMSILVPLALFISIGYEYIANVLETKNFIKYNYSILTIIIAYIIFFGLCYEKYIRLCLENMNSII
ncbi:MULTISPECIES: glycosyltransferase family 39 protein [Coprobacillaceae]|uniref:glycosyltransferase family 39 protein n=1 Tax=Coprobacillaceae TaxID=2810280 RepID=UPI000E48C9EF|nr:MULTISPECIES: glycosyltransferase family 39 protein [Coprobacillaceae]RHM59411.1 hypothetical protein DWZ53_09530 [Coprobacillus sp. AF33-1AC]RHS91743.1 hypothetical protein DW911_09675 [Erysipelatoclostridium sp. AM42-17]